MDARGFVAAGSGAGMEYGTGPLSHFQNGSETGGSAAVFEEVTPSGTMTPYHLRHDSDEIIYVLDRQMSFKIGEEVTVGGPGTYGFMPRGIAHAWKILRSSSTTSGREVLESVLLDAGHDVVTAINGKQGLERLTEKPPQLVLLDFMMPLLDGPGMLRAMKNDPAYRDIPAVLMSSLPESAIAEAASGLYSGFLRKPFKLHAVIEVINRVLNDAG
jgi:CheY-like chemotaxis protein